MGHEPINVHLYLSLTKLYDSEPTSFFHHQLLIADHYRLTHNDQLPNTNFWHYLEERRSINPHRFDHYHPVIGRWILEIPTVPSIPCVPPVCITLPCMPAYKPPNPGVVAEPASGILIAIGIVIVGILLVTQRIIK